MRPLAAGLSPASATTAYLRAIERLPPGTSWSKVKVEAIPEIEEGMWRCRFSFTKDIKVTNRVKGQPRYAPHEFKGECGGFIVAGSLEDILNTASIYVVISYTDT